MRKSIGAMLVAVWFAAGAAVYAQVPKTTSETYTGTPIALRDIRPKRMSRVALPSCVESVNRDRLVTMTRDTVTDAGLVTGAAVLCYCRFDGDTYAWQMVYPDQNPDGGENNCYPADAGPNN